jgi:hypothetical protein
MQGNIPTKSVSFLLSHAMVAMPGFENKLASLKSSSLGRVVVP